MKRVLALIISLGLLAAAATGALAATYHFTEDVTGDSIVCGDTTYTVVSGEISIVVHEGSSRSGNQNFTGTVVPRNVILEDEEGNQYRIVGAESFGGTYNAQQDSWQESYTAKFQIIPIGGGGVADNVNLTWHVSPNGKVVELEKGTCELPEE